MKSDALYRVIYLTDREVKGVRLIRIKGTGLDRLKGRVGDLKVLTVKDGAMEKNVFMSEVEKDRLIADVYDNI